MFLVGAEFLADFRPIYRMWSDDIVELNKALSCSPVSVDSDILEEWSDHRADPSRDSSHEVPIRNYWWSFCRFSLREFLRWQGPVQLSVHWEDLRPDRYWIDWQQNYNNGKNALEFAIIDQGDLRKIQSRISFHYIFGGNMGSTFDFIRFLQHQLCSTTHVIFLDKPNLRPELVTLSIDDLQRIQRQCGFRVGRCNNIQQICISFWILDDNEGKDQFSSFSSTSKAVTLMSPLKFATGFPW